MGKILLLLILTVFLFSCKQKPTKSADVIVKDVEIKVDSVQIEEGCSQ